MTCNILNKDRGAAFIEYVVVVAIFISTFILFGKLLSENSRNVARESHSLIADVVPCSDIGDSEYLLGSKTEDREICID